MSRYIDADDLLKSEIKRCGCIPTIGSCYKDEKRFDFVLQEQPTADVVEVVHGEWIEHKYAEESEGLLISNYECNQCHSWKREESNYCPNCGAKMRNGDNLSPTGKKVQDDL